MQAALSERKETFEQLTVKPPGTVCSMSRFPSFPRACSKINFSTQEKLGDPEVAGNSSEYQRVAKAAAGLQEVVDTFQHACKVEKGIADARQMLKDSAGHQPCVISVQNENCRL